MPKPNFFIVGFPKCGTTSLQRYLDSHPQVFMSEWKEPGWFTAGRRRKPASFQEYLALFDDADPSRQKAIGEATTGYIFTPGSLEALKDFQPDSKIIVVVRDPVALVWSLHQYLLSVAEEDIVDFRQAWDAQEDRRHGRRIPKTCVQDLQLVYGEVCRVGSHVKHAYEVFPKEQVLLLFLDDFKTDMRGQYLRTLDFLNLTDDGRTDFPLENKSELTGSAARLRGIIKNPNSGYYKLAGRLGVRKLASALVKKTLAPMSKKVSLDPEMRQQLRKYFAEEVTLLREISGRPLEAWSK